MHAKLALVALLLAAGSAAGTGSLETPVGSVHLQNGHVDDCIETVTGLCPASANLSSVSDGWIDLTQDNVRLTIAGNDPTVTELIGVELLPDGAIVIDVAQITLPNPAFRILMAEEHRFAVPGDQYGIRWDSEDLVVWRWSPSTNEPLGGFGHRETTIGYGSGWVTYERIGGFNNLRAPVTSDDELSKPAHFACLPLPPGGEAPCRALVGAASAVFNESTPAITAGLGIDALALAPQEDATLGGLADREAVEPLGPRSPALLPAGELARGPAQAAGLPARSIHPPVPFHDGPTRESLQESPRADGVPLPPGKKGGGIPAAFAAAAGVLLILLAAALYARITRRSDALASPQRAAMVAHLRANGPACVQALAAAMGVHRTTILHHALVLQRLGEIRIAKRGKYAILALPVHDTVPSPQVRGALLLVLDALRGAQGGLSRRDVHGRLRELPQRTRNHAIRELASRGLIEERGDRLVVAPSSA